jgi:hypothetical protein
MRNLQVSEAATIALLVRKAFVVGNTVQPTTSTFIPFL